MADTALDPDTALEIRISATINRHIYAPDTTSAMTVIKESAAGREDLLAKIAGICIGFGAGHPAEQPLLDALRDVAGVAEWIPVGRKRGGMLNATPHR